MNTDKIYAKTLASEYAPKHDRKVRAMMRLDRRAKLSANILAYCFGAIATVIMLTSIYVFMRSEAPAFLQIGICLIGFTGMGINYPIYKQVVRISKTRYAFEIVELARQVCEEN